MARIVRIAAASFMPPAHDHYGKGVDLSAIREVAQEIMRDRPDFICFPELCACYGSGLDLAKQYAPELEPYASTMKPTVSPARRSVIETIPKSPVESAHSTPLVALRQSRRAKSTKSVKSGLSWKASTSAS